MNLGALRLPLFGLVWTAAFASGQALTTSLIPGVPTAFFGTPLTLTARAAGSTVQTLSINLRESGGGPLTYSITANLIDGTVDVFSAASGTHSAGCHRQAEALTLESCRVNALDFTVTLSRAFSSWPAPAEIFLVASDGTSTSPEATVGTWYQPGLATRAAASRFLEQAAFGPRPRDTVAVMNLGLKGWLEQQFQNPCSDHLFYFDPDDPAAASANFPEAPIGDSDLLTDPQYINAKYFGGRFLRNAVMNSAPGIEDQLRQRVAFALSQFFVINVQKLEDRPARVAPFQEMLYQNAFSSFGTLLKAVTLHPSMGDFLDLAGSVKSAPGTASTPAVGPNENYPREILQLFSIGTYMLDMGGNRKLDNKGNPIPTYTQDTVVAFAQAMTGWDFVPGNGRYLTPMVATEAKHERTLPKAVLNGATLTVGKTAAQDMEDALNNILAHPNVAPFVSKFFIQHLVTSNPSGAYVARVATTFRTSNGDMKEVLRAILLDEEARAGDDPSIAPVPSFGHLQEPLLWTAAFLRAFNARVSDGTDFSSDFDALAQRPYDPPTVFNFYTPTFKAGPLLAPEFQLHSPWTALYRVNLPGVSAIFTSGNYTDIKTPQLSGRGWSIDFSGYYNFTDDEAGDRAMLDEFNAALMHGAMPAPMFEGLVAMLGNLRVSYPLAAITERPLIVANLLITSSYYQVMH